MNAGDTYRLCSGAHLWVVISEPEQFPDSVVAVSLTSLRGSWQDQSCILHRGEHEFIKHNTIVFYAEARLYTNAELDDKFARNLIQLQEPASSELLRKIRDGARVTPYLTYEIRQALASQNMI